MPFYYNPEKGHAGRKRVERSKFDQTDQEIAYAFGGYSLFKNVEGLWIDERGTVHKDLHHVVFILASDTKKTREWIHRYKESLEKRFRQKEIFIKVSDVRRI